jgi:hypothetical protein
MPSAIERELVYHPNAGVYQVVGDISRRTLVATGGVTVNQQITALINNNCVDRRPGSPNQLLGNDAVHYLECFENV